MLCNVVHILLKLRVVLEVAALVEVWNVNEVPVGLPSTTLVLYFIGEGCTFYERIHILAARNSLISHYRKNFLSPGKSLGVFLLQNIVSQSCD